MTIYQRMNFLTSTCSLGLGQGQVSEDQQCSAILIHVLNSRPILQLQFFKGEGLSLISCITFSPHYISFHMAPCFAGKVHFLFIKIVLYFHNVRHVTSVLNATFSQIYS